MDADIAEYEKYARTHYEEDFDREFADELEMAASLECDSRAANTNSTSEPLKCTYIQ